MTVWFTPRWRLRTGPPPLSARYRNTTEALDAIPIPHDFPLKGRDLVLPAT
jgi:hypothetical protein